MMFSKILDFNTIQCCLITAALFMVPLNHKKYFLPRFTLCVLPCLLCAPFILIIQHLAIGLFISDPTTSLSKLALIAFNTTWTLFIYLIILSFIFWFCCHTTVLKAIYYASYAYLTQDFAYTIFVILFPYAAHRGGQAMDFSTFGYELFIFVIVHLLIYFVIVKNFPLYNKYFHYLAAFIYTMVILIIGKILGTYATMFFNAQTHNLFRMILFYDTLLTTSLLISQIILYRQSNYQSRLSMESNLRHEQYIQFQNLQDSIEDIRHKSHDLKHILSALEIEKNSFVNSELLSNLETSILNYDSSIQTGNTMLDALLGKYFHTCKQHKIEWTCLANGSVLHFMDDFDLFIMLGNALDNAIESVCKISDMEKRFISVNIRKRNFFTMISIKNYCSVFPKFKDDLPITTKNQVSEHGYGMKSISSIVHKYDGDLSVQIVDDIFTLNILFPIKNG